MRKATIKLIAAFACILVQRVVNAGVTYTYVVDQANYSGAVGSTAQVNLYLQETLTNSSGSFIGMHSGLTTAGAAVNAISTTGGNAAQIATNSFTVAPSFGGLQTVLYNQGGNDLEFNESIALGGASINPTANRISLGLLNVVIGTGSTKYALTSLANDTISQTPQGLGGSDGNTTTKYTSGTYYDLDVTSSGNYIGADAAAATTFTVSPSPEPSSMVLAVAGLGLLQCRFRRSANR